MIKKICLLVYLLFINLGYSMETKASEEMKIGLVLSGGGAKGFAHIGLLKVIDEEKIPIDYVVGTSMGSIIGALYSMGYSGEEVEKIMLSKDWLSYFDDSISREEELIENKNDKDKYAVSFPIDEWKLSLPKGAVKGQNIDKVLEELYINAKDINDFSKLAIPFACVATDAETGNPVIFTKGYLSEAIRASMSLPGLLNPVELDGMLLLDGGLANNFPVSVALDMGANFIIGNEVLGDLDKKEKLNSAILIMNQAIAYKRVDVTNGEKEKTDILVSPNTDGQNIFSFSKIKEIIDAGEKAAREKIDEFKQLKNEEKFNEIKKKKVEEKDKFQVDKIEFTGLKSFSSKGMREIINLELPTELSVDDLNKLVEKAYNLRIFSKVSYKILGTTLKIEVVERADKELKLGFNYNETTKGDLFGKFTKKGYGIAGNRTDLEILLGKDEAAKLQNTWYMGPINRFGISVSANYSNVENYTLMSNGSSILDFNIDLYNIDFMLGTFLSNSQIIGLGLKKEVLDIQSNTMTSFNELDKYKYDYMLAYLKYNYDSLDDKYFPKKGAYVEGVLNYYLEEDEEDFEFSNYKVKFSKPIKLSKKLVLNIGGEKNYVDKNNMSPLYMPALGGVYSRQNSTTFWGLNPSEFLSEDILSGFSEILYEWKPYRYIVLRYNKAHLEPNSLYNEKNIVGGGIGVAVKTPLGPVQLVLSKSNKEKLIGYLNIGYNF